MIDTLRLSSRSDPACAMMFESNVWNGRTGSFEVEIDGKLVFSKLKEDRFPTETEMEAWK